VEYIIITFTLGTILKEKRIKITKIRGDARERSWNSVCRNENGKRITLWANGYGLWPMVDIDRFELIPKNKRSGQHRQMRYNKLNNNHFLLVVIDQFVHGSWSRNILGLKIQISQINIYQFSFFIKKWVRI
jgi:hypothetical protein